MEGKNIRSPAIVLPVALFVNIFAVIWGIGLRAHRSESLTTYEIERAVPTSSPGILKQVAPVYPKLARLARVEGIVVLEATTDIHGRVAEVKVLRSVPLLDQAAVTAIRQFIFEPVVIDSQPRSVVLTLTVKFQLT